MLQENTRKNFKKIVLRRKSPTLSRRAFAGMEFKSEFYWSLKVTGRV